MFSPRGLLRFLRSNGLALHQRSIQIPEGITNHHKARSNFSSKQNQSEDISETSTPRWYSKFKPTSWLDYSILVISGCGCAWFLHRYYYIQQAKSIDELMIESRYEEAAKLLESRLSPPLIPASIGGKGENSSRFTKGATQKLLECYSATQDLQGAARLILRMIEAFPEDAIPNRLDLAQVYIRGNLFPNALEQLLLVIKDSPESTLPGYIKNDVEKNIAPRFQRFLGLSEDDVKKLSNKDNAYILNGIAAMFVYLTMYPEADLVYGMSLGLNPHEFEIVYAHAAVKYVLDQLGEAQGMLEGLLASQKVSDTTRVKSVFTLVGVYTLQKNYNSAKMLCEKQAKLLGKRSPEFSLEICKERLENFKQHQQSTTSE